MDSAALIKRIMAEFANDTGLWDAEKPPRRYLWTDAFALCNFLALFRRTSEKRWLELALRLVEQVHNVLGRHRRDDPRSGWISGLSEAEGRLHPTAGGLRIGKPNRERESSEPFDERLEWDRDGQYYHYLTKWMHALNQIGRITGESTYDIWAVELAKAAHSGFVHDRPDGSKRMVWKMSVDLTRPLVPSMGQHDPLDGLITYTQLKASMTRHSVEAPDLDSEIDEMAALCRGRDWTTSDPLGMGMLLSDAYRIMQLVARDDAFNDTALLKNLLDSARLGLTLFMKEPLWELSADYRLAFREFGLALGLHGVRKMAGLYTKKPETFSRDAFIGEQLHLLEPFTPIIGTIEDFWLQEKNRTSKTWVDHADINSVMLATVLNPSGFLQLVV